MATRQLTSERWREQSPMWADDETGLPKILGPFSISMTRSNGVWQLHGAHGDVTRLDTKDTFAAFRAMVDAYEAWFNALPGKQVYFIGEAAEMTARVKIGVAIDPVARLKGIQTGYPERLQILATVKGGEELERQYHRRFRSQRRHGEWFIINGAILDEIERLNPLPSTTPAGAVG